MLQTIDLIIAYAVIMTVLSLLITVAVQMVSAALALRGKNLGNALALTFQTIDPKLGERAHGLAAHILGDPIMSDSLFALKSRPVDIARASNPLMKAVLTAENAVAAAEAALATAPADTVKQQALKVAEENLAAAMTAAGDKQARGRWHLHHLNGWWLASSVRPGEVYRVLSELAQIKTEDAIARHIAFDLPRKAKQLLAALGVQDQPAAEATAKLTAIADLAKQFTTPEQQKALYGSIGSLGVIAEKACTDAYDRFQRWFGTAQDRAQQWFQSHMRIITVTLSMLAAFVFQLDTVEILKELQAKPALVEALVKSAPGVLREGAVILDPADTAALATYLIWLDRHPLYPLAALPEESTEAGFTAAIAERLKKAPEKTHLMKELADAITAQTSAPAAPAPTTQTPANPAPVVQAPAPATQAPATAGQTPAPATPAPAAPAPTGDALKKAYDLWALKFPDYKVPTSPAAAKTGDELRKLVEAHLDGLIKARTTPAPEAAQWIADYHDTLDEGAKALLKSREASYARLKQQIDDADFDLIPQPLFSRWSPASASRDPKIREGDGATAWGAFCKGWSLWCPHFIGMLITAALLALGAPFWFNLLKNLMSLRPALATLIQKRPQSAPALPSAPASPGAS